jgi:hypothetical protein
VNSSKTIFLVNDNVRAIKAVYDPDEKKPIPAIYKTLDQTITVDDFIVVPSGSRHRLTVFRVVETDFEIDFDTPGTIEWVFGRVDVEGMEEIIRQEKEVIDKVSSAEKRRRREKLRETLLADVNGDLKALPIYNVEAPTNRPDNAD